MPKSLSSKKGKGEAPIGYSARLRAVISQILEENEGNWVTRARLERALRDEGVFGKGMKPESARVEISRALKEIGTKRAQEGFVIDRLKGSGVRLVKTPSESESPQTLQALELLNQRQQKLSNALKKVVLILCQRDPSASDLKWVLRELDGGLSDHSSRPHDPLDDLGVGDLVIDRPLGHRWHLLRVESEEEFMPGIEGIDGNCLVLTGSADGYDTREEAEKFAATQYVGVPVWLRDIARNSFLLVRGQAHRTQGLRFKKGERVVPKRLIPLDAHGTDELLREEYNKALKSMREQALHTQPLTPAPARKPKPD